MKLKFIIFFDSHDRSAQFIGYLDLLISSMLMKYLRLQSRSITRNKWNLLTEKNRSKEIKVKEKKLIRKIKIDPTFHLCNEWSTHNELLWESKLKFLFCPNRVRHLRSIEVARFALLKPQHGRRNYNWNINQSEKFHFISFTSLWFSSCRVRLSFNFFSLFFLPQARFKLTPINVTASPPW